MNHFSFVMVLLSIIVGLGITELLTNVARQIEHRKSSKQYWLHSVIVALVFLALLQQWWEAWNLKDQAEWPFPGLLLMIAGPVVIYIISHLLYPENMSDVDYDQHYHSNSRIFAGLAVLAVIAATLFRPLSFGHPMLVPGNIASLVMLITFSILTIVSNRRVHQIILPALLIMMVFDILVFTMRI